MSKAESLSPLKPKAYPQDTAGFWEAAVDGKLRIRTCRSCKEAHHYPRAVCPFCGSTELAWIECLGTGVIYSLSITRPKVAAPFVVAYVTLPEGVTMLSQIVDSDLDSLKIADTVRVVFQRREDGLVAPCFTKVVDSLDEKRHAQ